MPRSFDMAAEYEGSVEQVLQAFSDEQYWLARLADSGADDYSLDSMTVDEQGIDIVTTQRIRSDRLPGVVTQFHRGDLTLVREEAWSLNRDGQATATIKLAIIGAPATLSGSAVLSPAKSGGGSLLELKGTVQVHAPLGGGNVEELL